MAQHSSTPSGSASSQGSAGGVTQQEIEVKGGQLVDKFKEIVEAGNARRVTIKKDGRTVMELPLTVGAGAATAAVLLNPMLAAIGAVGALMSDVKIVVERGPSEGGSSGAGSGNLPAGQA